MHESYGEVVMKNIQLIIRVLSIFWGIVLFAIVIKALVDYLPKKNWHFSYNPKKNSEKSLNHTNYLYFPLKERHGFTLDGYKSCIKHSKTAIYKRGYNFNTSESCWNNDCSLHITFTEKIPQNIDLFIKKSNTCITKKFSVPKTLDIISYYVDLKLSPEQKHKLDICSGDKIRLKHANGYTLDNKHKFYTYSTKRTSDTLLVNNQDVGKIYFSKAIIPSDISDKKPELNIPHPKELYTFNCDSKRSCEITANSYIVNMNGIDFIPKDEFILKCLNHTTQSKYCSQMTHIGDIKRTTFDSDSMMHSYIESTKNNPEFNHDLKEWKSKRLKKAQEEVMFSL